MPYAWVILGGIAAWLLGRALSRSPDKIVETPNGPVLVGRQITVEGGGTAGALSSLAGSLDPYPLKQPRVITSVDSSRLLRAIEAYRRPRVISEYAERALARQSSSRGNVPRATAQVDRAKALVLAPQVDNNVRSAVGFCSPELIYEFQVRVGLDGTGKYCGRTKGAVEYYTRSTAPEPIFPPYETVQYEEPV